MLLKTVGKNPELFCYYVSIQEAKELLKEEIATTESIKKNNIRPKRVLTDC